jgi:hypothetical protein
MFRLVNIKIPTNKHTNSTKRVLLEKLILAQLVKEFLSIDEIQRFITMFTRAHN